MLGLWVHAVRGLGFEGGGIFLSLEVWAPSMGS